MGPGVPWGKGRLAWKVGIRGTDGDGDEPDLERQGLLGSSLRLSCVPSQPQTLPPPAVRPPWGELRPERVGAQSEQIYGLANPAVTLPLLYQRPGGITNPRRQV